MLLPFSNTSILSSFLSLFLFLPPLPLIILRDDESINNHPIVFIRWPGWGFRGEPAEHERRDICRLPCGMWSATFFTNLLLSVKYYVSLRRNLHRILRYHHSWKKFRLTVVDRSRRREEKVRKERRRKKKKGNEFFVMVRATSVIRVKNRYESARVLPLSHFPPPPPIESISCALRLSRISFIVQRQNKSTLV